MALARIASPFLRRPGNYRARRRLLDSRQISAPHHRIAGDVGKITRHRGLEMVLRYDDMRRDVAGEIAPGLAVGRDGDRGDSG